MISNNIIFQFNKYLFLFINTDDMVLKNIVVPVNNCIVKGLETRYKKLPSNVIGNPYNANITKLKQIHIQF